MRSYKLGQIPSSLSAKATLGEDSLSIELISKSGLTVNNLKLTSSHYDDTGRYLDYSEISFDELFPHEERREIVLLDRPSTTSHSIGDISALEQTWLKRHWQKLSTIALVIWTIVILGRRLI